MSGVASGAVECCSEFFTWLFALPSRRVMSMSRSDRVTALYRPSRAFSCTSKINPSSALCWASNWARATSLAPTATFMSRFWGRQKLCARATAQALPLQSGRLRGSGVAETDGYASVD